MKWIRFERHTQWPGSRREARLGLENDRGQLIDLKVAAVASGFNERMFPDDLVGLLALERSEQEQLIDFAQKLDSSGEGEERAVWHVHRSEVTILAPVARPSKIICIGLNYVDHVNESGAQLPSEPVFFSKYPSSLTGPGSEILKPSYVGQLDFEVELALVIGKRGRFIPREAALDHVFGYTILNDISARDWQFKDQWVKGKALDTFAPVGPAVVSADAIPNPQNLRISLAVNGQIMQDASTTDMIFDIKSIIEYVSQLCTLEPGDLIATGTPPGVAFGRGPDHYLKPGDTLIAEIEGLGRLENRIVELNQPDPSSRLTIPGSLDKASTSSNSS